MSGQPAYSTACIAAEGRATSRRQFIRRAGKAILAMTVVDLVPGYPRNALAADCSESPPDANCGVSYEPDEHCGVARDADNNCGTAQQQSPDANCGNPTDSGVVAAPNQNDRDEACAANCVDDNCSIAQLPSSGHGADVDQSCGHVDGDQSCGDCDDDHDSDEHCGGGDTDDLCGHQHYIGHTQDAACNGTMADVGCGTQGLAWGQTSFFV